MANEKHINSRIQHKHDIEANLLKATTFIPKQGELIIYDIDDNYNYERVKVGDGVSNINTLPFITDGEFLKKTGDWMTGPFGLSKDIGYGTNLPSTGQEGQVFFLQDEQTITIPAPTANDNGKFLCFIDGQLKWMSISN